MPTTRRIAVSYSRFSDPKQAKGDSECRQEEYFRDFCTHHNLTPAGEVYVDRGRSGYHDEHRKKGRLGDLITAARDGRFDPGTVIVIESWDRLGRLRPDDMVMLVRDLVRLGVGIGVYKLNDIFIEEDFGSSKWTTLAVFIQLAYQESKQKAERLNHSWRKRRQRARESGRLMTGRIPAWLKMVNGQLVPIPERVATLKRIFRLSADGYGKARIISQLIAEGCEPFGSGKWTTPYVEKILRDRRVRGEYQPRRTDDTADGQVIAGYYPEVITEDEYLLARSGQNARRVTRKSRDRRWVNVFQSLIVDARDGGGFFMHNSNTSKKPRFMIVNANGQQGRGPTTVFSYPVLETAILHFLREITPRDVLPKRGEDANRADVLREKLKAVREDVAGLKEELAAKFSKGIAVVLRQKETEEEQIATDLQDELAKTARPIERAWEEFPTLAKMVEKLGDDARLKLRPVLRRVVDEIRVVIVRRNSFMLMGAQVFFHGGAVRSYLIAYQYSGFNRPLENPDVLGVHRRWACSLADVVKDGSLDLRKPDHAKRLETSLLRLSAEALNAILE